MTTGTISIIRGDDAVIPVTIKNADGTPYNLTGCQVYFTVRALNTVNDTDDTSALFQKTLTITNATGGAGNIILTNIDTNKPTEEYVYDMQIITADVKKYSASRGVFYIVQDITKT